MSDGNWIQQKNEGSYKRRPKNNDDTVRKTREDRGREYSSYGKDRMTHDYRGREYSSYGKDRMTHGYDYRRRREVREKKPDKFVYSNEMFPQMSNLRELSKDPQMVSTSAVWNGNLKNLIDTEHELSDVRSEKKTWGVVDKRLISNKPLTKFEREQIMKCCVNYNIPQEAYIQKIMKEIWYDRFEKYYDDSSERSESSSDDLNGYSFPIDEWSEVSEITSEFLEEYDEKHMNANSDDETSGN